MIPQSFLPPSFFAGVYPLLKPLLFLCQPEKAHTLTIQALKILTPRQKLPSFPPKSERMVAGIKFPHAVGLAAGFDKNAEVVDQLLGLGFSFVEVGTITPLPQKGNPQPRLFRLEEDEAVINRMGFNNDGVECVASRLALRRDKGMQGIVGANIGANKESENRTKDYLTCFQRLHGLADYFTANVSSPNTPNLRNLQNKQSLLELFLPLLEERSKKDASGQFTPVFLKIAPDLSAESLDDIAEAVLELNLDGVIISNTTINRPLSLKSQYKEETGGLSGKVLRGLSTHILAEMHNRLKGKIPLIGVGGITDAQSAYEKKQAGASLIQLYSGLVYKGPTLIHKARQGFEKTP
jgi:dihydroorotate dehydrogenase